MQFGQILLNFASNEYSVHNLKKLIYITEFYDGQLDESNHQTNISKIPPLDNNSTSSIISVSN